MNIPLSVPMTFQTCLGDAVEEALRDAGINPMTFRYTTIAEGLLTDGTRFAVSLTDGEAETSREIQADLLALVTS